MTDLAAIRARDTLSAWDSAIADRRTLLAEVDRRTALLSVARAEAVDAERARIRSALLSVLDKGAVRTGQEYVTVKVVAVLDIVEDRP